MGNILNTEKDTVMMGSGYLYAIEATQFVADMDVADMIEIGYIQDGESATFTRTHEMQDINSANYGLVDSVVSRYTTEFDTSVISYKAENVSRFLTGSKVVTSQDGKKKTMYYCEGDKIPNVALAFVTEDEDNGKKVTFYMPKSKWIGDYEVAFSQENPVALNYHFTCLNTTLPNGKVGAAYHVEEDTSTPYVSMNSAKATVAVSDTVTLGASTFPNGETIAWSSSDTGVATVNASTGVVTGVAAGKAIITATITKDTKTYTDDCIVTVVSAAS